MSFIVAVSRPLRRILAAAAGFLTVATPLAAQVGASDYARAEALLGWNARDLVVDEAVAPHWIAGDRFWYRNHGAKGYEFIVVDAATGTKRPLFDNGRLASELEIGRAHV